MPGSRGPRNLDNPSTYIVQDRKNKKELTRLAMQDQILTAAMGGVLSEQTDPSAFRQVLDVGCGTGGWLIDAAKTYPEMMLVGIDISQRMIKYANAQAETHDIKDRVEFHVMDALSTLDFATACFDLVNLRAGVSFVRTWEWPKVLGELLRITCPGGVVRLTDSELILQSNSPALGQLCEMNVCACYRAGHLFDEEVGGMAGQLERLLNQYGCQQVQAKVYAKEYRAGTADGEAFYQNMMLVFQTIHPFIQKWGCAGKDYDSVYRQALKEMQQPDFHVTWKLLTAWGNKPRQRSE